MGKNLMKAGLVVAACLTAGEAMAQGRRTRARADEPGPVAREGEEIGRAARSMFRSPETYFSRENFTAQAGGGWINFTNRGTDEVTGAGGGWTVRGIFGVDQALGVEGGYLGAVYPVSGATGDEGNVVSNGLEVLGRVGYPIRRGEIYLLPYAGVGVGVDWYNLTGVESTDTGMTENDGVFTIPIIFGVGGGYGRLSLDMRFAYRPAFGDEMFEQATDSVFSRGSSTLSVTGLVGYQF